MPLMSYCIGSSYEPGHIGASVGTPPTTVTVDSIYTPDTYDPGLVTYSLDFSKFYNSALYHYYLYGT